MNSINTEVWRYIDNHQAIKRNLAENIINIRALAKKIIADLHLSCSLNAVISAIRRYSHGLPAREHLPAITALLQNAKLFTRTRLASLLLQKNESVRNKLAQLYAQIDFQGGDLLHIFEVNKYIKIIIDEKTQELARRLFTKPEIVTTERNLSELSIVYVDDITRTPGVFAFVANELAANNLSIVDSIICHSEHIIIVPSPELQKGFNVLFNLTNK